MKGSLSLPISIGALLLALLGLIYLNAPVVDVHQQNAVLDSIRDLKHENNALNQNLFEVSANRVRHYSYLSHSQRSVANKRDEVEQNLAQLSGLNRQEIDDRLGLLKEEIKRKDNYIERFKQRHARFKNSLDYYPSIMNEIRQSDTDEGLISFYESLAQNVIYYALSGDRIWHEQATGTLDKLTKKLKRMKAGKSETKTYLVNFISHSRLLLEGAGTLSKLSQVERSIPVNKIIDELNSAFLEANEILSQKQALYRNYLLVVIFGFVLLVAYTLVLVARNAVALAREKQRAEVTLGSIGNGVIVTDTLGLVEFLNPMAEELTGFSSKEAHGHPIEEIFKVVTDDGSALVENSVRNCLRTHKAARTTEHAILISHRQSEVVVDHAASPILDQYGKIDGVVMVFDDVTTAHRMARKLEYQATHDGLTGLVNRREFENRISESLVTAKQDIKTHVLLYLDLDQFKVVNDTCGHVAGDELLKQVVEEIKVLLRASDTFARLGGDEFGVLLNYCTVTPAEKLAEKILKAVQDYRFSWDGKTFQIGVSIGVVPITHESENLASVLSAADMACYSAKDLGRNRVHVFEASDQEVADRKVEMNWVARINDALNDSQFVLYGQRIAPISDDSSLYRQELLVRMQDEDGSHIPPGAFLPAAARYNSISKIDLWVITHAFKFYQELASGGQDTGLLCINISGDSLVQGELVEFVCENAKRYQVESNNICFEITETEAVTNLNDARDIINRLKDAGFKFALDDFGSGMSSFSYLKNLPVNYLKIDGSLVKDIVDEEVSRAMVEMITRIAHIMGMQTIAEFVENDDILNVLKEIGVDYAQGYGIDMPKLVYTPKK